MRKFWIHLVITAALIVSLARPVWALSPAEQREISRAAVEIAGMMQNIMENYMGRNELSVSQLYEAAMEGMASMLDSHSRYISPNHVAEFELDYFGNVFAFGISLIINADGLAEVSRVVPASPAQESGISRGDIVLSVNGEEINRENFLKILELLSSSELMTGNFVVLGTEGRREFAMTKSLFAPRTVLAKPAAELVPGTPPYVGYILIEHFGTHTAREMSQAIRELQNRGITRLILDLRYNPGGDRDAVTDIARMLVPEGVIYTMVDSQGRVEVERSRLARPPFAPMVVLTNGHSASAAELLAMAMGESGAATIVGQQTYGKGSVQTIFPLSRGDFFIFTTMEYFGRNGTRVSEVGVQPDIEVSVPEYLSTSLSITRGHRSQEMPQVKRLLRHLGYSSGAFNNYFDEQTQAIILHIQERYGLNPSGNIDQNTVMMLNLLLHSSLRHNDIALNKAIEVLTAV